jgi:myosin heavy subunit
MGAEVAGQLAASGVLATVKIANAAVFPKRIPFDLFLRR